MKKKMLFMAALAGAVTLGSCVKDDVSSSVEAVRNAKAAQLNSEAALNNANAAHRAASSAADIALTQAQTAHENALAAVQQALADKDNLQNELDKAAFEDALEALKAQYAYTVADNKEATQVKLNSLLDEIAKADDKEYKRVAALITQFQTAYNNWVTAQNTLVQREVEVEIAKISAEAAASLREKQLLNDKADLEAAQAVLDYILEEGQSGDTPAQIAAKLAIINSKLGELQLKYQNSAELPAFVKESNNISKPYSDWYKANAKIASDLAALSDADLVNTAAFAKKLFTAPAKKGGIDAVWDNKYDSNNVEAAAGTKYYASYVYLGAKKNTTPATYVASEIEKIANPVNPATKLTVNFDGKFNAYAIASADDIKAIKAELKKDSTAFESAYAAAIVAAGIGAPTDPANPAGSLYAKLAQAKLDESAASAAYTIAKATLDNDILILAADGSTPTPAHQAAVDADYTAIYGPATVPASVTDAAKWKASAASIAYRPNNAAGMADFDLTTAKEAVKTAQENLDTAIAALTIGDDSDPAYPGAGDTRNEGLAKVAKAKTVIDGAADDMAAYTAATTALTTAEEAYNKAAKALMDVVDVATTELNAEKVALEAIYAESYEVALTNQQVVVNQLKENIAALESVLPVQASFDVNGDGIIDTFDVIPNPDRVIEIAEQNLVKAQMDLVQKTALLEAARKAIENSGIEYEIEDNSGDDEPETPETPAEGEGEGESEGEGEEA